MPRAPPAWPRRDGAGAASAPTNRSPSGPPSRVGARLRRARVRPPSRPPLCGWTTGRHRAEAPRAARATAPEARGAARAARLHCAGASHPGPRARVRCSERGVAQSSAARSSSPRRHPRSCDPALTTRSPESAAPPSDPGLTGTPLPDPLRSDDQQLAPWPASATHGAPAYPLRDRTGIQAESFARNPYEIFILEVSRPTKTALSCCMARPLCVRLGAGPSGATLVRRIARDEPPPLQQRTCGLPDVLDGVQLRRLI